MSRDEFAQELAKGSWRARTFVQSVWENTDDPSLREDAAVYLDRFVSN